MKYIVFKGNWYSTEDVLTFINSKYEVKVTYKNGIVQNIPCNNNAEREAIANCFNLALENNYDYIKIEE